MSPEAWILEEAARLENENIRLKAIVAAQDKDLIQLSHRLGIHEQEQRKLRGYSVAVIGPSFRETPYKQAVTNLGGQCRYGFSNEKLGKISRVMQRSDGAVFITSYASHKAGRQVKAAGERYGIPVIYLDHSGIESFEEALLEYLLPMMKYCQKSRTKEKESLA